MRDTVSAPMMSGKGSRLWEQVRARVPTPTAITSGVIVLCVVPLLFLMQGQRFDLVIYRTLMPQGQTGLLTHAALVLLGSGVALLSSALAFVQYRVRHAPLLAVIGLALFWSGLVALAQVLIFEKWMYVAWRAGAQTPLGWTLARFFTASILVSAAGIVLYRSQQSLEKPVNKIISPGMLVGIFVSFGMLSALTMVWLIFGPLPDSLAPNSIVKRPWDIPAMIVLLIGGLVIFPRLHRRYQSTFSYSLWLSMVPLIAAQCYLLFYSQALFDSGYLVAYGLILVSFIILSSGMAGDYLRVTRHEMRLSQELKVREARIRAVLENATDAIIMIDHDFKIQLWNPPAEEMFGYCEKDALGQALIKIIFGVEPHEARYGILQEMLKEELRDDYDGAREISLERGSSVPFVAEYTIARSVLSDYEENEYATFFVRDRTEQHQLRMRMIQMDRLITTGTFAAGVGHELSNPLTYVLAHLEMARDNLAQCACREEPEALEIAGNLDTIEQGVERIRGLVQDLKLMSSFQESKKHPIALQDAAQIAAKMTRHISSMNATVVEEYGPVPKILADDARLTQVFINLITNAVQALPARPVEENRIVLRIYQDQNRVVAEVEDNGLGMSPEVKEQIFEQFFTTKAVGKGTGLGLALCDQIVASFDGHIEVESSPGMGSTFRLFFPAYESTS